MKFEKLIVNKYLKFHLFADSAKPRMLFFLLKNVKMPTIVDILTFMSRKKFYNLGARAPPLALNINGT